MSSYVRSFTETFEFDGDNVEVTFKPLRKEHMLTIMPLLGDSEMSESEKGAVIYREGCKILPEYVASMKGLIDGSGEVVDISEVCEMSYFSNLVVPMFAKLIEKGSTSADEKKQ